MLNQQKETENIRRNGQRRYNCLIIDCPNKGRIVGKLGNINLTYCPQHRKKGERILNFLINSVMRYKLTNFLRDSKQALFMKNEPKLCNICYDNIQVYINNKILEIDEIEKVLPLEELDLKTEEFIDEEE